MGSRYWELPLAEQFNHVARNLSKQWEDDGFSAGGNRWEDQPSLYKLAYLANFAVAFDITFERYAAAAKQVIGTGQ